METKHGAYTSEKDMNFGSKWFVGALICAGFLITALAETFIDQESARLEEDFTTEENQLSLELKELQLRFYESEITGEELQEETDNWYRRNQHRLEKQSERAAAIQKTSSNLSTREVDQIEQPLDTVQVFELPSERKLSDAEIEYSEIQNTILEAHQRILGDYENSYDARNVFGEWSENHQHLIDRREQLTAEMAKEQWDRLEPIEIDLPEDASPEEEAFADLEERRIARTFDLRGQYNDLGPDEFREILQNDSEFADLVVRQETYFKALAGAELKREIARLKLASN